MNKTKWNKIKPAFRKINNNNQAIKRASNYTLTANYKIQTFKFRAKKGIITICPFLPCIFVFFEFSLSLYSNHHVSIDLYGLYAEINLNMQNRNNNITVIDSKRWLCKHGKITSKGAMF